MLKKLRDTSTILTEQLKEEDLRIILDKLFPKDTSESLTKHTSKYNLPVEKDQYLPSYLPGEHPSSFKEEQSAAPENKKKKKKTINYNSNNNNNNTDRQIAPETPEEMRRVEWPEEAAVTYEEVFNLMKK